MYDTTRKDKPSFKQHSDEHLALFNQFFYCPSYLGRFMNQTYSSNPASFSEALTHTESSKTWTRLLQAFASGLLLPLGFAPFHLPGFAILSLALLFLQVTHKTPKQAFILGFVFAAGVFGLGTSWVYNSIHTYGHLNLLVAGLITFIFIAFFSLYTGFFALLYTKINKNLPTYLSPILFATLWLFSEYLRAISFTGFPWLLLGFGQMDSPLQHLLPLIGVLGVSWVTALAASFLALAINQNSTKKRMWLLLFVFILILPITLKNKTWTQVHHEPISVGVIQADLSMRDKWDNALYQKIQSYYQQTATTLMPKKDLIVMPEAAIPLPSSYAGHFLGQMHADAENNQSAVLIGMPHPSKTTPGYYHNALLALGHAKGTYAKQHLVPFGEYLPKLFKPITTKLNLPEPNITPGHSNQTPITFNQHTIASLICYELAYPALLRAQLPHAAFIVSVSDDGWFGKSLAVYQQLQMAQVLSKQTGRYQIVSNNDGLSSFIDATGHISESLPAFSKGILEGNIYPASGATPWVEQGDNPIMIINILLLLFIIGLRLTIAAKKKRRYPS